MAKFTFRMGPHGSLVDYSQYVTNPSSWEFFRSLRHRGGYAAGSIEIHAKAVARPKALNEIHVAYPDGSSLFGGVIQSVRQKPSGNPDLMTYQISAGDYSRWLDHIPIGYKAYTGTVSAIVREIIDDWVTKTGFMSDWGHIGPAVPMTYNHTLSPLVDEVNVGYVYTPNFIPVGQALDFLAKTFNAVWFIDPDLDLWFYYPDGDPFFVAPISYTQPVTYFDQDYTRTATSQTITKTLPAIRWDTDYPDDGTDTVFNLELSEEVPTIISAIQIRDYYELSTEQYPESFTGDGSKSFFPLANIPGDVAHTSVVVNGNAYLSTNPVGSKALLTEYIDGQPTDASPGDNCYVCKDNKGIRFGTPPGAGQAINVNYNYFFPGRFPLLAALLAAEIAGREGFGPGYYYEVISDESLSTPITLAEGEPDWMAKAKLELMRFARMKVLASFESKVLGWKPGQILGLVSTKRGDSVDNAFTGWNQTLSMRLIVSEITYRILNDTTVQVQVNAATDIWGE